MGTKLIATVFRAFDLLGRVLDYAENKVLDEVAVLWAEVDKRHRAANEFELAAWERDRELVDAFNKSKRLNDKIKELVG